MSVPLLAQQGQTGVSGFQFLSPLQIAVGSDNNFLVDRTDPNEKLLVLSLPPSIQSGAPDIRPKILDDKFFLLTLPRMAYQNDSRRHELTLTWLPEFELFKQNTDQNSMNQQATASFGYFLTRNLQITLADSYRTSMDPARTLDNVFLLLPRSPYKENDVHATVEYQPNTRTNVAARYDMGITKFGQTDPFQTRILDTTSTGYSLALTRMLRPTTRIRFTYSLFTINPINQSKTFDDAVDTHHAFQHPINSGTVEYKTSLNPSTVLEVAGGVIKLDTGLNYSFRGTLDKRFGNFWAGGGYLRTLAFQAGPTTSFAQGLNGNGFFDVIVARFRGQPSKKTAVLFNMTLSRDASNRFVEDSRAALVRARFDYRVSDRSVLFFNWESFQQSNNVYVQEPLSRNRFTTGIEISLSSESQQRANKANQDAQYVALTDHQRRRRSPDGN
jgi:hypothetical protein